MRRSHGKKLFDRRKTPSIVRDKFRWESDMLPGRRWSRNRRSLWKLVWRMIKLRMDSGQAAVHQCHQIVGKNTGAEMIKAFMLRGNQKITVADLSQYLPDRLQALSFTLQAEIGFRQFGQGLVLIGKGLQGVQAEDGRSQAGGIAQDA